MLTRREFLAAGTAAAALAATPSCSSAQIPRRQQAGRDAVPPTSPNPVSTRPRDNLGGSTVNVGSDPGDLQTAVNAALNGDGTHKGNTLVVPTGVRYNPITMPLTTGSGWTCLRSNSGSLPAAGTRVSPSNASAMFKVVSSGQAGTAITLNIPPGSNGWRFIGMEATHPNANRTYAVVFADGERLSFERCYVHGHASQTFMARCFFVRGSDVQFWDSHLSDAKATDADTQAIFARNNARMHVENCELQSTGENIMLGDQGSSLPTTDVTVRRNHFFKPLSWQRIQPNGTPNGSWDGIRWLVKNHFEVKFAQRVLVEGNYFQNNWAQGQDGTAVATFGGGSYVTSDVMYRSNIIRNSGYMFSVQTVVGTPPLIARIAWLNNLGLEIAGRMLFINHAATDLWLEHNTGAPMDGVLSEHWAGNGPGGAVQFALDAPGRNPRMTIKRNVFGLGVYGMINLGSALQDDAAYDLWMPDRTFAENALYGWSGRLVSGVTPYASAASAGVDLVTGTLIAGSPLIGAGSDGKDIGVDFVQLAAAQTGTQTEPQRKHKGRGGA